jgi:hypothetical protein
MSKKISERTTVQKLTLNIGKLADGTQWLCLANADTTDVYPLAKFTDDACVTVFQDFMRTEGYQAVKLPSNDDINDLLGDI